MLDMDHKSSTVENKGYACIGLLRNRSDVYHGRTFSFTRANFCATVTLHSSHHLVINPHPKHDLLLFSPLPHLVNRLQSEDYYGGVRLLMSMICKVFYKYCTDNNIHLHNRNFILSYDSNILRQTRLSGSSAIVSAALNCLLDFYQVRHLVKVEIRPNLVLSAEKNLELLLGFKIGWRRSMGALFTCKEHVDNLGHEIYTPMDINLLPPLHLIYAENPSDSGKVHSTVRRRWPDGDKFIISSMSEVADLALQGQTAILEENYSKLADLMNHNFDLRRSMFGDDVVCALNIEMVEVARRLGAASKFTGSGGAVVVFCPDGPSQVRLREDACEKAGFVIEPVKVVPSYLNEYDLKTPSYLESSGSLVFFHSF